MKVTINVTPFDELVWKKLDFDPAIQNLYGRNFISKNNRAIFTADSSLKLNSRSNGISLK